MKPSNTIDRKTFLTSTAAWAALTLSGCSDDGDGGGAGTGGQGTATGGSASGGTSGSSGSATGGMSGGGTSSGGMSSGGVHFACATQMSGNHVHPLTIASMDVEIGYHEGPYVLEDGGTGHTHTLEVTAYDFMYLQAGTMWPVTSSTDSGHSHICTVTCTRS